MKGRVAAIVLTGTLSIVTAAFAGRAQAPKKLPHIGSLSANTAPAAPILEAFRQGLSGLGWIEGQNIALEWRSTAGQDDLLPAFLDEPLQCKVDIIVAGGPQATRAAKH